MHRPDEYELTLLKMTARECLEFLEAIQSVAFNYKWHLHGLMADRTTHNITLELAGTLDEARAALSQVASTKKLPENSWQLLPTHL